MGRCPNWVCMIGVEFLEGSIFESVLFGDAIFMKVIITFLAIYLLQKYIKLTCSFIVTTFVFLLIQYENSLARVVGS
jgi:hypothetical protein